MGGPLIDMPLIPLEPTPGGCQHSFSPQASAPSEGVEDNTLGHSFNPSHRCLAPSIYYDYLSRRNWLTTSTFVFIPIWVFYQSPHSVSIPVTASLSAYQAATIARQPAFWVVSISFQGPDSYQSQRPWTCDDFQPRAKCVCDCELERQDTAEAWLWRVSPFLAEWSFSLPSPSHPLCASHFNALSDKT